MTLLTVLLRDNETQICSCHNVTKGALVDSIMNGSCKTIGEVKLCTKAGTGCGGCMPLVQSIFNKTMLDMGQKVSNYRELLRNCHSLHVTDYIQSVLISRTPEPTFTVLSL
jgi:NAD(P)H-nitrite reductase large subunit